MKKVLIDIDNVLAGVVDKKNRTGLYWTAYNIICELINSGSDITFITNRFTTYIYKELCKNDEKFKNFRCISSHYEDRIINYIISNKIKLKTKRRNSNNIKKIYFLFVYLIFALMDDIIDIFRNFTFNRKTLSFDIYQSFFYKIPDKIAKSENIKKFIFVHDILPLMRSHDFKKKPKKQMKIKNNFYNIFTNLDNRVVFFYNSKCTKKDFLRYFPKFKGNLNIVAYLAADRKMFFEIKNQDINVKNSILKKYDVPVDKKYILSLSSLNPRKNLLFLVESFCKFLDKNEEIKDLYLVLAGPRGWQIDNLFKEIADNEKYRDKIIITGFINEDDINIIYNSAFCFAFPSLYEGFGLPILEAMQCGLPTISSNTSSMPEVYGNAALEIDPKKEDDLINAISNIYYNEDFRVNLSKKSLNRSKHFDWRETAIKIIEQYKIQKIHN